MGAAERAAVTELWVRVYQIADRDFQALGMKPPGRKGVASDWIVWKANLPPRVTLDWKIKLGAVELSFLNGYPRTLDPEVLRLPDGAISLRYRGVCVVRQRIAPPNEPWTSISNSQIMQALSAANCLLVFYHDVIAIPPCLEAVGEEP